jgi:hypothetical protein
VQVSGFGNYGYLTPLRRLTRLIRRKRLTLTGQPSAVQRCALVCSSGQHFASGLTAMDGANAGFIGAKTCPAIRSQPRHPCLWLTLPLAGCVEDLHLQVTSVATTATLVALARDAPCLAHHKKSRSIERPFLSWCYYMCAIVASPNSEQDISLAPSIKRSKS